MDSDFTEFTVMVPVSQFVKVEADAAEHSRSLKETASFLLSKWVQSTRWDGLKNDTVGVEDVQ